MNVTVNTKQNQDGSFSAITRENQNELEQFVNYGSKLIGALQVIENEVVNSTNRLNQVTRNNENAIQRYLNTENNRQMIYNNEFNKHNDLMNRQNNLLGSINIFTIKLWRFKNLLYFRTNSGKLIIDSNIEIQKELSSRYGVDVHIVNDINDALRNNNQYRINTVFIAINNIAAVEEEVFDIYTTDEIFFDSFNIGKRNLLAYTRYNKIRFPIDNIQGHSTIRLLMIHLVENTSDNTSESISKWIGDIGSKRDTMLLLVGNKSISKDLVFDKIVKALFDTGIVLTITDEILSKQNLEQIVNGKLFLHINHIPHGEEEQKKLKDLIISVVINKAITSDGYTIPTQAKIIVTINEPDLFFKDFLGISTTLFIDSKENILSKFQVNSFTPLYQAIESSLDSYSDELKTMANEQLDIREDENKRYVKSLNEANNDTCVITESGLPILDPYSDSYKNIIANDNRFKHTYVIANQGFGKSQLIISSIMRDYLLNDCSIVLLDPHGDLAEDLLKIIDDKERLVYIDLYLDKSRMPTINLFDIVDKNDEDSIYNVTQLIVTVFKNISSEDKLNGLMENVTENCISVMLREGGGSFWELYQFLGGSGSKDWIKIGRNSPNPLESNFFNNEFDNESATRGAVKRRLYKLIRDPKFSAFMNRESTFNLEQLVNTKGKIIIFNIASGRMPNTYQYYMKFLVGYLQLIALRRVSTPMEERIHTQVYIDEFHLFLDKSKILQEILTGARKYRMFLIFAHQLIAQLEDSNLKEVITTVPTRYFIGNIANKSVEVLSKALNEKLDNPEKQLPGEFYFQEDNKTPFKIKNTDKFLNGKEDTSPEHLEELIQYQNLTYYDAINSKESVQTNEVELQKMIQRFKNDLLEKNLTELSCLYKLKGSAPKLFDEIVQNFEYVTIKDQNYTPRVLKRGINEIFKLAFELNFLINIDDFAKKLASQDNNDMFNNTDSGTRQKEFTDDGKTKTEQYYYFQS